MTETVVHRPLARPPGVPCGDGPAGFGRWRGWRRPPRPVDGERPLGRAAGWAAERARGAWADLLELVFPRRCVECGEGVGEGPWRWTCLRCAEGLHRIERPWCPRCGRPLEGPMTSGRPCADCQDREPAFTAARSLLRFSGTGATWVREIKYHGARYLAADLRRLAQEMPDLPEYLAGAVLVPVPLHPARERARGFNQARVLAEALADLAPGCAVRDLLVRTVFTESQTRLDRARRRGNVKNAFATIPGLSLSGDLLPILVDDVFTTGSTLDACAAVLRRAGAARVRVLTLAHG